MFIKSLNQDLSSVRTTTDEKLREWEIRAREIKEEKDRELRDCMERLT
jgi:hypothetical protein